VVSGRSLGFALLSNTRVIAFFDLLLAVVTGWLLWRSLDWPLVGDAAGLFSLALAWLGSRP
jgi:hypothetical protein